MPIAEEFLLQPHSGSGPLVEQKLLEFRSKALTTIMKVYLGLIIIEFVAILGLGLWGRWLLPELSGVFVAFTAVFSAFKIRNKRPTLAIVVFLGLLSLVQLLVLWTGQLYVCLSFSCAIGCFLCVVSALLLPPKRALYFSLCAALVINASFCLRLTFSPTWSAHPEQLFFVLLGFVSFVFTAMVCVLTYWLTRDFLKALQFSQTISNQLSEANEELIEARDSAMHANKAKSQFLANMSHELRTPLNAIIGYSELIREDCELGEFNRDGVTEDLDRVLDSSQQLLMLINDILDVTKIESGKLELTIGEFDAQELCGRVEQALRPIAKRQQNELVLEAPDTSLSLWTDEARLRQILSNLLSNACQFTEGGKVSLRVDSFSKEDEPWVRFEVEDDGQGIPEDKISQLFEIFEQADMSHTRSHGGIGLGLALSYKLTCMLEGHLYVRSTLGEGSCFTVELPRMHSMFSPHSSNTSSSNERQQFSV